MKFFYIVINFLENFYNGWPLYLIIELISLILRLRNIKINDVEKLSPFKKKILNSRLRLGYKVNFLNLNLINAYKLRLFHFACIALGFLKGDSKSAKNYLSIIGSHEFIEYLQLDNDAAIQIKNLIKNDHTTFDFNTQNKIAIGKAIFIGPSVDPKDIDINDFDTIIFIKPPTINLSLKNKNIVVILNNIWIKKELESINIWYQKNPNTLFLSPQDIKSIGIKKEKLLDKLLIGPFGSSPMGLQRGLFLIKHKYTYEKLTIIGFNLGLSIKKYHESYPSIIHTGTQKEALHLRSNASHDFYYNFYLTRYLLNNDLKIETNLTEITNKAPQDVNDLFKKAFK